MAFQRTFLAILQLKACRVLRKRVGVRNVALRPNWAKEFPDSIRWSPVVGFLIYCAKSSTSLYCGKLRILQLKLADFSFLRFRKTGKMLGKMEQICERWSSSRSDLSHYTTKKRWSPLDFSAINLSVHQNLLDLPRNSRKFVLKMSNQHQECLGISKDFQMQKL